VRTPRLDPFAVVPLYLACATIPSWSLGLPEEARLVGDLPHLPADTMPLARR
jgi:hypothetical protein